jgi:hypothetical protein
MDEGWETMKISSLPYAGMRIFKESGASSFGAKGCTVQQSLFKCNALYKRTKNKR